VGSIKERRNARMVLVEKRVHFEDLGVEERMILKWICKKQDGGVDWIHLARN
jgi:hypothetical protein